MPPKVKSAPTELIGCQYKIYLKLCFTVSSYPPSHSAFSIKAFFPYSSVKYADKNFILFIRFQSSIPFFSPLFSIHPPFIDDQTYSKGFEIRDTFSVSQPNELKASNSSLRLTLLADEKTKCRKKLDFWRDNCEVNKQVVDIIYI